MGDKTIQKPGYLIVSKSHMSGISFEQSSRKSEIFGSKEKLAAFSGFENLPEVKKSVNAWAKRSEAGIPVGLQDPG